LREHLPQLALHATPHAAKIDGNHAVKVFSRSIGGFHRTFWTPAFKRRIKTQTVLPSADTAAMLFWALLASGQISMRKVDGWQTLTTKPIDQPIDLAA
jgi:hypothetical protein